MSGPLPELLDVEAVAAELRPDWDATRARRWIYRLHEEHGLPAIKLGRSLVFERAAVLAWLAERRRGD